METMVIALNPQEVHLAVVEAIQMSVIQIITITGETDQWVMFVEPIQADQVHQLVVVLLQVHQESRSIIHPLTEAVAVCQAAGRQCHHQEVWAVVRQEAVEEDDKGKIESAELFTVPQFFCILVLI